MKFSRKWPFIVRKKQIQQQQTKTTPKESHSNDDDGVSLMDMAVMTGAIGLSMKDEEDDYLDVPDMTGEEETIINEVFDTPMADTEPKEETKPSSDSYWDDSSSSSWDSDSSSCSD